MDSNLRQVSLALSLLLCGCGQSRGADALAGSDSLAAARALGSFLEEVSIVAPTATYTVPESMEACQVEGASDPYFALAAGRVLGVSSRRDSLFGTAEIVTVGSLALAADGEVFDVRVEIDTLTWRLVKDSTSGHWFVCGRPDKGYDFMRLVLGPNTAWRPSGATLQTVMALADSVRKHY